MIAAANQNTFLIREHADEYHAKSRDYLSSHQLAEFRRCPQLYHRRKLGLIEDVDRPAYLLGRAAHVLILEGLDAFDATFAVGGPINPKTDQPFGANTKTWAECKTRTTVCTRSAVRRKMPQSRCASITKSA